MNRPVDVEAFEQQKDGVLLLSCLQSGAMRLHADEPVSDQRLSHVVQLSCIDPAKNNSTGHYRDQL